MLCYHFVYKEPGNFCRRTNILENQTDVLSTRTPRAAAARPTPLSQILPRGAGAGDGQAEKDRRRMWAGGNLAADRSSGKRKTGSHKWQERGESEKASSSLSRMGKESEGSTGVDGEPLLCREPGQFGGRAAKAGRWLGAWRSGVRVGERDWKQEAGGVPALA